MIDFNRPLGGIGFSTGVGPLSYNPLGTSFDVFGGGLSGASNFAMANPAMSLIAEGFGTGAGRTYSPFGVRGMYGSYGLSASMLGLGGLNYIGQFPNFTAPLLAMLELLYTSQPTPPAGPSQAAAPQPPPPAPDETGKKGGADKADQSGGADKAGGKGDAAEGDWKAKVGKDFNVPGIKVAGTDEKDGKKIVRLTPESGFDPKTARPKLGKALQVLHKNGVQAAMVGDKEIPTGSFRTISPKTGPTKTGKTEKSVWEKAKDAVGLGGADKPATPAKAARQKKIWVPNTNGILKALEGAAVPKTPPTSSSPSPASTADAASAPQPTAPAPASAGATAAPAQSYDAVVAEALRRRVGEVKDLPGANYAKSGKKGKHRIIVRLGRHSKPLRTVAARVAAVILNADDDVKGSKVEMNKPAGVEVVISVPKSVSEKSRNEFFTQITTFLAGGGRSLGEVKFIVRTV